MITLFNKQSRKWMFISFLLFALLGCVALTNALPVDVNGEEQEESWQESPVFTVIKQGPNGEDVNVLLRGIENKLAILEFQEFPMKAGELNKQAFHFWGETPESTEQLFRKRVKVLGTSQEDSVPIVVFDSSIGVPNEAIIPPPISSKNTKTKA